MLLAIVLNVAGFLIYIFPALFISLLICSDNFKGPTTEGENLATLCLALGIFAAVEGITFMLRSYREKRTRHPLFRTQDN